MTTEKLIIELEAKTSSLDTSLRRTEGNLDDLDKSVGKTDTSLNKMEKSAALTGKALAGMAAAAAATIAVITKVTAVNAKFEQSIADLAAITGAAGEDLKFLSDEAKRLGSTTAFSAVEASTAFRLIASAKPELLENSEALAETTEQVLILAEASGQDLASAADITATALNQFGASADETARFVNVLAAGSKLGASEVNETAEALKNAGVAANAAGVSFEETNAAIQILAATGVKGAEAGTALRNIFLKLDTSIDENLRPSVVGLDDALENLGKQNLSTTELVKLFGLENVNTARTILEQRDSLGDLTIALTGTETALEQASIRSDTLEGDLKSLGSASEGLAITVGEKLNPAMRFLVQEFTDLISQLDEGIKGKTLEQQLEDQTALIESLGVNIAKTTAEIDKYNERIGRGDTGTYNSVVRERNELLQKQAGQQNLLNQAIEKQIELEEQLGQSTDPLELTITSGTEEPSIDAGETPEEVAEREKQERLAQIRAEAAALEAEREQARIDQQAERILESYLSREEQLALSLERDLEILENSSLAEEELIEARINAWDKYYSDLDRIRADSNKTQQKLDKQSQQIASSSISALSTINSAFLEDNKGLRASLVIADTAAGIARQFSDLPYPAALATSAAIAATGAAQLASISSSDAGGGSISSVPATPAPTPEAPQTTPPQEIVANSSDVSGEARDIIIKFESDDTDTAEFISGIMGRAQVTGVIQ